jgi:hypothetical protein
MIMRYLYNISILVLATYVVTSLECTPWAVLVAMLILE